MAYVGIGSILKEKDSVFKLTLVAAKRAIELSNGAEPLVETKSKKFSTIALEEITAGKVDYREKK